MCLIEAGIHIESLATWARKHMFSPCFWDPVDVNVMCLNTRYTGLPIGDNSKLQGHIGAEKWN